MALLPQLTASDSDLIARFRTLRTRADVAAMLEVPERYLYKVLYLRKDTRRYRNFGIRKRTGGTRIISAPPPALAVLQSKLNYILQLVYVPGGPAHGFVQRRSIRTNADRHVGKRWVLNIDLEDFFPSIHFGRVRGALEAKPLRVEPEAAKVIAQICTNGGVLPQGAPTSPMLANIVCGKLDGDLVALARRHNLWYTRYCDDLTFSSRAQIFPTGIAVSTTASVGPAVEIGAALKAVVEGNNFKVNPEKTRLQFRTEHQEVTGITVNSFPNVPRTYIRSIRGMLYAWRRHSLTAAATVFTSKYANKKYGRMSPEDAFRHVLRGRVEYVGFIRGRTDPIYCKLRESLHGLDHTLIAEAPTPTHYPLSLSGPRGDRWTRLFAARRDSIFHLEITTTGTNSGTAFAIALDRLATAAHNLVGAVTCYMGSRTERLLNAHVHTRGEKEIDAAICSCPHGATPVPADRRLPEPGEPIAIIGFASVPLRHPDLGLYVGTVESIRLNYPRTTTYIHVSVPSGGGLSGSPAFDSRGRLVGLVIESVFEQVSDKVPGREYCTILPTQYLLEIDPTSVPVKVPMPSA
jgi:RNA-directed DNA polymerase